MMENLLLVFIPPFLFLLIKILIQGGRKRLPLPPGPSKLPFIGNIHQLLVPAPHRTLRDLANKYGPLMHLKLGHVSTIIVSSAEVAKEIMKTNDANFSNRPKLVAPKVLGYNYTDIAFAPYGPYWRQLRKICTLELLTSKRVNSFRHVREEEVSQLIRSITSSGPEPINFAETIFALNHTIITRIIFGNKCDDQQLFRAAMKEGISLAAGFHIGDFFPSLALVSAITGMKTRLEKEFQKFDSIMSKMIQQRIETYKVQKPVHEGLIDVLIRLKDDGGLEVPMTIDNIKSVLLDAIIGASENSSNTVEWAMAEMIKCPRILKKAQAEVRAVVGGKATVEESDLQKLAYTKMVIKETLRFHPPVPLLIARESRERCTIHGYEIPAKTRTIINFWAISRDPISWGNADIFEPKRFEDGLIDFKGQDFEYIPFGAGRRICPGISMGIVSIELILASLLYHFDWKLPEGMKPGDLDMGETFALTVYKSSNLCLVPTLHFPLPN